jgi:transposase
MCVSLPGRGGEMREGITVEVSAVDRGRLEAIVADRNSPQKHVWRARIVLLTADGLGTNEIMRQAGTSKVTVWRWQERFMRSGVAGLLRDKTRPSRIAPLPASVHERTVALTLGDPPGEATHWTAELFRSLVDLQAAIKRFLAETNDSPKPFVWTAAPDQIIAAVRRGYQVLDSIH